jgi:hypothetical protein
MVAGRLGREKTKVFNNIVQHVETERVKPAEANQQCERQCSREGSNRELQPPMRSRVWTSQKTKTHQDGTSQSKHGKNGIDTLHVHLQTSHASNDKDGAVSVRKREGDSAQGLSKRAMRKV